MRSALVSLVTATALVLSGSGPVGARTAPAPEVTAQQVAPGPDLVDPGGAQLSLRRAHEDWIAHNNIVRLDELDALASEYVAQAVTADWAWRTDPVGVTMADVFPDSGEYVQVGRFTVAEAEAWGERGMLDIPAAPDTPIGMADSQDDNYIYVVLAFGSLPTVY